MSSQRQRATPPAVQTHAHRPQARQTKPRPNTQATQDWPQQSWPQHQRHKVTSCHKLNIYRACDSQWVAHTSSQRRGLPRHRATRSKPLSGKQTNECTLSRNGSLQESIRKVPKGPQPLNSLQSCSAFDKLFCRSLSQCWRPHLHMAAGAASTDVADGTHTN